MYARTVTFDFDTRRWEETLGFGESIRPQIATFPGLVSWVLVANNETGKGTSFSTFDSEDSFLDAKDRIDQILSDFSQFLTAPPHETLGQVLISVQTPSPNTRT
jgi:hypothetical protein